MLTDPVSFAVAATAVFLVALAKSGLIGPISMVGVPLLTLIMPAREAAGLLLPVLLVMDVIGLLAYRRGFDLGILKIMLPGAVVGIGMGWILWAVTSESAVRLMIGLITLAFVLDHWFPLRKRLAAGTPSKPWGVFWGSVAGFTSFVSHTGGPPYQIYTLPQRMEPALFAGTSVVFFAIVNTIKLVPYGFLGQLSGANLTAAAALSPVAIGGMLLGVYLVRRISADLFYKVAYSLVFLLALKLVWDGSAGLLAGG
ncbi:MAG: sulfite exporter TauE/SafE family protein [Alphaproteobacteria bacterium]|nr:sulfite exporter TauE/SafE family protein [Alphaproteobacteria bacterium]